jgi:cytochrome c
MNLTSKKILAAIALLLFISCAKKAVPVTTISEKSNTEIKTPAVDNVAIASGQQIYNNKCGRCHGLKRTEDYTAERWVGIMHDMAFRARLDSVEKSNVLAYVQANAKR